MSVLSIVDVRVVSLDGLTLLQYWNIVQQSSPEYKYRYEYHPSSITDWRLATGVWRLASGDWRLESGIWNLEATGVWWLQRLYVVLAVSGLAVCTAYGT